MIALAAVVLATGWVAALIAAPLLPGWAGAMVYGIGSFVCHQIPERSFHLAGFQLPVCARCLGIYLGASAGAGIVWMRVSAGRRLVSLAPVSARRLAVAAAIPTLVTVALEFAGIWFPSNVTRALAGVPLGAMIALVVMSALATLHYDECVPRRPTVPKPPQ
ncbi:MAG TPA: DUF2085 domain-containing protein [Vicinamibacterales bacterium]|nr:DUF2085 domain-containing protein [Vicinamibacterales bacterium]